ncbi:MAG: phosphatase PAP2 family protein [Polyangiales bacterium]
MKRIALAFTVLAMSASEARADEPRTRDVQLWMGGNPLYDFGFVALNSAGMIVGTYAIHPARRDRPPLDGLGHRDRVEALGRAADFAVGIGLATGTALSFLGELGTDVHGKEQLRGPVIVLEGALAGSMITQLLKNVFGVCRPRDWDEATRKCTTMGELGNSEYDVDEANRSFPSGHSAPLAGMAGAAMGMYLLSSPHRPEQLPVALTTLGFALTVVVLRERAGAHSWVDTGAAFISGGLAGFLTAALHVHRTDEVGATPAPVMASAAMAF